MSFRILSSILRQTWVIDEQFALAHWWLVDNILNGHQFIEADTASSIPMRQISHPVEPDAYGQVLVIPVHNVLMKYDQQDLCSFAVGMLSIGSMLREADKNPEISAVVLDIDSPGGTADGTLELAMTISSMKKPVVAYSRGMALSGAFWIASAAKMIFAENETVRFGSIGVQSTFQDIRKKLEKDGVSTHIVRADQSPDKNSDILEALENNYEPLKTSTLNPLAKLFISHIKANLKNLKDPAAVTTGKVFFAMEALEHGLITNIGRFDAAILAAFSLAGKLPPNSSNIQINNISMKKYDDIALLAGGPLETTDDGLFLTHEIAETVNSKIKEVNDLVTTLTEKVTEAEKASVTLTASLASLKETHQQSVDATAELQAKYDALLKEPHSPGGGADTDTDDGGDPPADVDPVAMRLYNVGLQIAKK